MCTCVYFKYVDHQNNMCSTLAQATSISLKKAQAIFFKPYCTTSNIKKIRNQQYKSRSDEFYYFLYSELWAKIRVLFFFQRWFRLCFLSFVRAEWRKSTEKVHKTIFVKHRDGGQLIYNPNRVSMDFFSLHLLYRSNFFDPYRAWKVAKPKWRDKTTLHMQWTGHTMATDSYCNNSTCVCVCNMVREPFTIHFTYHTPTLAMRNRYIGDTLLFGAHQMYCWMMQIFDWHNLERP